jgi:hypothetical protein
LAECYGKCAALVQFQSRVVVFIQWGFHYLTFDRGSRPITGALETDTIGPGRAAKERDA